MFQLINAVGVGYDGVVFGGWDFACSHIKHTLPPIYGLPLLNHTGDIRIAGINHFARFLVVFRMPYAWLWDCVRVALVGRLYLLLIKARHIHNLI